MEESTYSHTNHVTIIKKQSINSPTKPKENDTESIESYDFLRSDILARVELLEKEIKEIRKQPKMVDFSCQTERSHYDSHVDCSSIRNDISTQTYLENTSTALLNLNGRLEELKYYLNDKIDKLQYNLKQGVPNTSLEYERNNHNNNNGSVTTSVPLDVYPTHTDTSKVKYTPYSIVKPMETNKFRAMETSSGKPLDIRASLEKSKQLFQQEIEASLQHGRMQQQTTSSYGAVDKKASAFTQYMSPSNNMIASKGGVYNVYNSHYYDGRRSMYYEKHPFQISREEYARELVDEMFAYDELAHANVTGVKGKRLLDQKKIQVIKDSVFTRYPLQPSESEEIAWKLICDKINTKCRGVTRTLMKRKANNSVNGYSLDYYPVRKKSTDREYFNDMPPSMANSMYQGTQIVSPVGVWSSSEREIDKAREPIYISDLAKSYPSLEKREIVISDSETNVTNGESTDLCDDKVTSGYSNSMIEDDDTTPPEEIIVCSPLHRPDDNNSTSNDDPSEDRHNISFTQSNDDNLSSNGDETSRDGNSEGVTNEEEKRFSVDNERTVVVSSEATKHDEGFKPYSSQNTEHDLNVIPTQPTFTYPPLGVPQTPTSGVAAFTDETRKLYDLSPEGRRFCRQECTRGSRKELTRNLIDSMFSRATLAHSNVTGARGKSMLEPVKIAKVREMVFAQYPANNKEEEEVIWRKLTTKINTKCRGVKRFLKRKNLLEGSAISTKDRIIAEMEGNIDKNVIRTNNLNAERGTNNSLEKINDYYVSMVGRNSYDRSAADQNMIKSSLVVDRFGVPREKQSESQYASMLGGSSMFSSLHSRDVDGNLEKSSLRSVLGLDRALAGASPDKLTQYSSPLQRGVASPIQSERMRDHENNNDKPTYNVSCSTPDNINTYPYRRSGSACTLNEADIKKESPTTPHPNIFSYNRNLPNSEKEVMSASDGLVFTRAGTDHIPVLHDKEAKIENNIHRSAFSYERADKSNDSRSIFNRSSSPRITGDSLDKNLQRGSFPFDRNVTSNPGKTVSPHYLSITDNVSSARERSGSREYDIESNSCPERISGISNSSGSEFAHESQSASMVGRTYTM